ncbi:hypothetical protein L218DRAFT_876288 [Marasmius fiardii PR-910]|nr:hypothetical protein L218DRAFT_876288 [Marasmius fiardii PR-910]
MHLVTSSLFAQSIVPSLSPKSQALFLRSYFAGLIISFTTLGRPKLDLEGYFAKPVPELVPRESAAHSPLPASPNPNPWLTIVQRSIVHPDDHVPKFIRALFEYASKYGSTPKGSFANTELEGASAVDGTLFIRAAVLTIRKVGREVEKMPDNFTFWDRRTFREEGRGRQIY